MTLRFVASEPFLRLFPHATIGLVYGELGVPVDNISERIAAFRQEAETSLNAIASDNQALLLHPHISEWRHAYELFGMKVKSHKPTHEALAARLLKGKGWPSINPIVDIYLTNQVAHLLPHGGYDRQFLVGDLTLDLAQGDESFIPLGGAPEDEEKAVAGEVIYRDEKSVTTRRWNYRDGDRCKITELTKDFILFIEAPSLAVPSAAVERAALDLVDRIKSCYDAKISHMVVRPSLEERVAAIPL